MYAKQTTTLVCALLVVTGDARPYGTKPAPAPPPPVVLTETGSPVPFDLAMLSALGGHVQAPGPGSGSRYPLADDDIEKVLADIAAFGHFKYQGPDQPSTPSAPKPEPPRPGPGEGPSYSRAPPSREDHDSSLTLSNRPIDAIVKHNGPKQHQHSDHQHGGYGGGEHRGESEAEIPRDSPKEQGGESNYPKEESEKPIRNDAGSYDGKVQSPPTDDSQPHRSDEEPKIVDGPPSEEKGSYGVANPGAGMKPNHQEVEHHHEPDVHPQDNVPKDPSPGPAPESYEPPQGEGPKPGYGSYEPSGPDMDNPAQPERGGSYGPGR